MSKTKELLDTMDSVETSVDEGFTDAIMKHIDTKEIHKTIQKHPAIMKELRREVENLGNSYKHAEKDLAGENKTPQGFARHASAILMHIRDIGKILATARKGLGYEGELK